MRTWARRTAGAAMFTASFVAAGTATTGLAFAGTTSGNNSVGGGNQLTVPISIPVNVCGNALALLGGSFASCAGGAWTQGGGGSGGSMTTSGNHSVGGGNQASVPISIPVDVCGNAAAILGRAAAGCAGGAWTQGGGDSGGAGSVTSGNNSILGGNQFRVPVRIPVNVCGNAVGGNVHAGCQGGAFVAQSAGAGRGAGSKTSGNHSILGGNQFKVPVNVPVNVCGNSVAVLGGAASGCVGGAWTGTSGGSSSSTGFTMHSNFTRALASSSTRRAAGTAGVQAPLTGALSGLTSNLPLVSSLPNQLSSATSSTSSATRPIQAKLLSAETTSPGMGSGSLAGLAFGALLAGAATLLAAGRRISARRAGR